MRHSTDLVDEDGVVLVPAEGQRIALHFEVDGRVVVSDVGHFGNAFNLFSDHVGVFGTQQRHADVDHGTDVRSPGTFETINSGQNMSKTVEKRLKLSKITGAVDDAFRFDSSLICGYGRDLAAAKHRRVRFDSGYRAVFNDSGTGSGGGAGESSAESGRIHSPIIRATKRNTENHHRNT